MKKTTARKMLKVQRLFKHHVSKLLLATALTTAVTTQSQAQLRTHEWQENHRGYSIELIPGTGAQTGNPAEYVAFGSYQPKLGPGGWHFMHLDDQGNIIDESRTTPQPTDNVSFQAVDIACVNNNEFWITVLVRDWTIGSSVDYFYVMPLDVTGTPMSGYVALQSTDPTYDNLYPTNTFYAPDNNSLYICGYGASGTASLNDPDAYYAPKIGMMVKFDLSSYIHSSYFWDAGVPGGINGKDFDMALKIAPYGYNQTFPLLVTGAATTSTEWVSGILLSKFDASGVMTDFRMAIPSTKLTPSNQSNPEPIGAYGIDIRGGVFGGQNGSVTNADVVVLVNEFDESNPSSNNFGVLRVRDNMLPYGVSNNSYKYYTGDATAWGKQFLELHTTGNTNTSNNHIYMVGEQTGILNPSVVTIPSPNLSPNAGNVNPFIFYLELGYTSFDFNSGFVYNQPLTSDVYLSSAGTQSTSWDYLTSMSGTTSSMADVRRMYTFASVERFYDNPSVTNPPVSTPGMVLPIADAAAGDPYLKTKFLQTTDIGGRYKENVCNQQVEDLPIVNTTYVVSPSVDDVDVSFYLFPITTGTFSLVTTYNTIPTTTDCNSGYYKPTGIASFDNGKSIKLYPNPASNMLNVELDVATDYTVTLTDVTGRVVYSTEGNGAKASLSLPTLSAGMYLATVTTENVIHTEKLVIE